MEWEFGDPISIVLMNGDEEVTERIRYVFGDPNYPVRLVTAKPKKKKRSDQIRHYFARATEFVTVSMDRVAYLTDDGERLALFIKTPVTWTLYPGDQVYLEGDQYLEWTPHKG